MPTSDALRHLVAYIAALEDAGYTIVDVTDSGGMVDDETLDASVAVEFSPTDGIDADPAAELAVEDATTTDAGAVRLSLDVSIPMGAASSGDAAGSPDETPGESAAADADTGTSVDTDTGASAETGGTDPSTDDSAGPQATGEPTGSAGEAADPAGTDASSPPNDGSSPDDSTSATDDDPDRPAYRDPDRLRAAYEAHDTFAEMTEALGVDVTPQTVRKHAIRHGIHDPETRSRTGDDDAGDGDDGAPNADDTSNGDAGGTSSDPDTDDEPAVDPGGEAGADDPAEVLSDGVGLPEDVSIIELKEAVRQGRTLYDVQRTLDLSRAETHELLTNLDLLDLVQGRVSDIHGDTDVDVIESRIRSAMNTQ